MKAVLVGRVAEIETTVDSRFMPAGIVRDGLQYLLSGHDNLAHERAIAFYVDVGLEEYEANRLVQGAQPTRSWRTLGQIWDNAAKTRTCCPLMEREEFPPRSVGYILRKFLNIVMFRPLKPG